MASRKKTTRKKATGKKAAAGKCIWSGRPTKSPKSAFAPGGDAQYKSALLRVIDGLADASERKRALSKTVTEHPKVKGSKHLQALIRKAHKAA